VPAVYKQNETCFNQRVSLPVETPVARLAASQLRRIRRIVDAAVALAEEGGFENVRLRDVADASGVALGTLYKYFHSKEDILLFALNEETERLESAVAQRPPRGGAAVGRMTELFARATRGLTRRPKFAKAVLRAIASGDDATAAKVAGFHLRMLRMVLAAMRDEAPDLTRPMDQTPGSPREQQIATLLAHVWFAALVGWSGGLHPTRTVTERMRDAIALLLDRSDGSDHSERSDRSEASNRLERSSRSERPDRPDGGSR
jgi:TetR/AcrR family transcriptional regulator, cholesterol catabolism regulator